MISKHIRSIGAEVECGIDRTDLAKLNRYVKSNRLLSHFGREPDDGSVGVPRKDISDAEFTFWHTDIKKFLTLIRYLYQDCNIKTNHSCGLHLHIKLDEQKYTILACQKGINYFLDSYRKKFQDHPKYINRLRNGYCRADVTESTVQQQVHGNGTRYKAINFVSLKESQETLEFRIFPNQKSYSEFEKTTKWFIATINQLYQSHQNLKSTRLSLTKFKDPPSFKSEILYIEKLKKSPMLSIKDQLSKFGSLFKQKHKTTKTTKATKTTKSTRAKTTKSKRSNK